MNVTIKLIIGFSPDSSLDFGLFLEITSVYEAKEKKESRGKVECKNFNRKLREDVASLPRNILCGGERKIYFLSRRIKFFFPSLFSIIFALETVKEIEILLKKREIILISNFNRPTNNSRFINCHERRLAQTTFTTRARTIQQKFIRGSRRKGLSRVKRDSSFSNAEPLDHLSLEYLYKNNLDGRDL